MNWAKHNPCKAYGTSESPSSKHTKGPWHSKYHFTPNTKTLKVLSDGGTVLAKVCRGPIDQAEAEANGGLIAAAPDLLAACKATLADLALSHNHRRFKRLENAIAKAEGGE